MQRTTGLIRMGLMGAAFIALTIVLIVFQPGSPRKAAVTPVPESSVTRVAPAMDNLAAPSMEDVGQKPPAIATDPVRAGDGSGVAIVHAEPSSVRDLTFGAISNLKSATTGEAPAPGEPGSFLHSVVQRSLTATASTPTGETVAPRQFRTASYFVRPGDTLISIAQEVYGNPEMASALFETNTDILPDPDMLRAGMVLSLPDP
ncbi:LysM peptidoglycan-binding domain-containing protein [Marivita hallyeonensis]|uniref:LysM domain-containing protein n=1 Tax=Marivita hallyeonensis TaxID=996342 RepID=A0A1M5TAX3_9RHOB|nr:hypothetical protein [Marivita hallyeonensis]SHH47851.1 hypothetical protein SAMN05443551_2152 [Marivita hallyeonensis]